MIRLWVVMFDGGMYSDPVDLPTAKTIVRLSSNALGAQKIMGKPRFLLLGGKVVDQDSFPDWVAQYRNLKGI